MSKKVALLVFGMGDGYCDKNSERFIFATTDIYQKLNEVLNAYGDKLGALVSINNPIDSFKNFNLSSKVPATKNLRIKLCSNQLLHVNNELSLTSHDGEQIVMDGDQLDFILRPEDYEIHIAGVDINGVFINAIEKFNALGYSTVVYSDAIKPFTKDTIRILKSGVCRFSSWKTSCRA